MSPYLPNPPRCFRFYGARFWECVHLALLSRGWWRSSRAVNGDRTSLSRHKRRDRTPQPNGYRDLGGIFASFGPLPPIPFIIRVKLPGSRRFANVPQHISPEVDAIEIEVASIGPKFVVHEMSTISTSWYRRPPPPKSLEPFCRSLRLKTPRLAMQSALGVCDAMSRTPGNAYHSRNNGIGLPISKRSLLRNCTHRSKNLL